MNTVARESTSGLFTIRTSRYIVGAPGSGLDVVKLARCLKSGSTKDSDDEKKAPKVFFLCNFGHTSRGDSLN